MAGNRKMQPGSACPAAAQPVQQEVDVPGRPEFVNRFVQDDRPIPATAVRAVTPEGERRTTPPPPPPDRAVVYLPAPAPEMRYFGRCFAYAYITAPPEAPCKADPELLHPGHGADRTVRFRTPEDREAAMARQPFALDGGGASVKLVREGETSNVRRVRLETLVHVALLEYPKDQRNFEDIQGNCGTFGHLVEVDPACYDAPDLSPVRVVVKLEHARDIPRQVRIRYGFVFRHVVPVQILRVWDWSESVDANGAYVPMYGPAAAARP